jgi:hypothetical protein
MTQNVCKIKTNSFIFVIAINNFGCSSFIFQAMSTFKPTPHRVFPGHAAPDNATPSSALEPVLWKMLMLTALAYFIWSETLTIDIGPLSVQKSEWKSHWDQQRTSLFGFLGLEQPAQPLELGLAEYDHLTGYLDPGFAKRYNVDEQEWEAGKNQCIRFVRQFYPVAIAEMRRSGVPASILLAQALLASDAGMDETARETNNYFLRPCARETCQHEHQSVESDDDVALVDTYTTLWGSFRAQSNYLVHTPPFTTLADLCVTDHRVWVKKFKQYSESNDPKYAQKIGQLIEAMNLAAFDGR